jgi:hypothetical protein
LTFHFRQHLFIVSMHLLPDIEILAQQKHFNLILLPFQIPFQLVLDLTIPLPGRGVLCAHSAAHLDNDDEGDENYDVIFGSKGIGMSGGFWCWPWVAALAEKIAPNFS